MSDVVALGDAIRYKKDAVPTARFGMVTSRKTPIQEHKMCFITQIFRFVAWYFLKRVWFIFLGQAAATRQALQSRKSAQRLFSRQHLTASRALAPAFDQRGGIRMAELRVLCLACHDAPCCSRPDARCPPFAGLRKPPRDRPMLNPDAPECNPPKRRQSDRKRKRKTDSTQKYKPLV